MAQPQRRSVGIKVRATRVGYYDEKLRRVDDVFVVTDRRNDQGELVMDDKGQPLTAERLLGSWMERVDPETPEQITSHNEVLRQQHDEIMAAKTQRGGSDKPTGAGNPLGG